MTLSESNSFSSPRKNVGTRGDHPGAPHKEIHALPVQIVVITFRWPTNKRTFDDLILTKS